MLALALVTTSCHTTKPAADKTVTADSKATASLNGNWELDLIPYPNGTFENLYPDRKPTINFNEAEATYSAYTGCNTARGKLDKKDANTISFKGDMMMTRMACQGDGEKVFLENIKKVNKYSVAADGKTLTFIQGDIALMRFHRLEK